MLFFIPSIAFLGSEPRVVKVLPRSVPISLRLPSALESAESRSLRGTRLLRLNEGST